MSKPIRVRRLSQPIEQMTSIFGSCQGIPMRSQNSRSSSFHSGLGVTCSGVISVSCSQSKLRTAFLCVILGSATIPKIARAGNFSLGVAGRDVCPVFVFPFPIIEHFNWTFLPSMGFASDGEPINQIGTCRHAHFSLLVSRSSIEADHAHVF